MLVLGVRKTDDGPQLLSDDPALQPLALRLDAIGVTGGLDEVRRIPFEYGRSESLALVGVGSGELTIDDLRYAAGSAARQLRGIESIVFGLPSDSPESALAILEGAAIGAYSYVDYRVSSLESAKLPATTIVVATTVSDDDGTAIAEKAAVDRAGDPHRARPREPAAQRPLPRVVRRRSRRRSAPTPASR